MSPDMRRLQQVVVLLSDKVVLLSDKVVLLSDMDTFCLAIRPLFINNKGLSYYSDKVVLLL